MEHHSGSIAAVLARSVTPVLCLHFSLGSCGHCSHRIIEVRDAQCERWACYLLEIEILDILFDAA